MSWTQAVFVPCFQYFVFIPFILSRFPVLCVWNCCHSLNVATGPTKFVTSLFCLFKYQITRISIRNNYYFSGSCSIDALFSSDTVGSSLFTCSSSSRSTDNFPVKRKKHSTDKYTRELRKWDRIKQGGKCAHIIKIL
jgi:hypothetical protein